MATRRDIREEIEAAHSRDKQAEEKAARDAAIDKFLSMTYNPETGQYEEYSESKAQSTPTTAPSTPTTTPSASAAAPTEQKASPSLVSEDYLKQYLNRDEFSYEPNADPKWQAYKNQYMTLGRQAAMDTYGKAVTLTGGYGNSYAQGVSQQVEDEYAARAADKIPELYAAALDRYDRQGQEMLNKYSILYGREQDAAEAEAAAAQAEEETRRWWAEYGLKANAQEFNQWLETSKLTLEQQKVAADIAYQEGQLTIAEYNAITARINAETNQFNAETSRYNAETSRYNAGTSRMNAETSAYNAQTSRYNATNLLKTQGDIDKAVEGLVDILDNVYLDKNQRTEQVAIFLSQFGDQGEMIGALAEKAIEKRDAQAKKTNNRMSGQRM